MTAFAQKPAKPINKIFGKVMDLDRTQWNMGRIYVCFVKKKKQDLSNEFSCGTVSNKRIDVSEAAAPKRGKFWCCCGSVCRGQILFGGVDNL